MEKNTELSTTLHVPSKKFNHLAIFFFSMTSLLLLGGRAAQQLFCQCCYKTRLYGHKEGAMHFSEFCQVSGRSHVLSCAHIPHTKEGWTGTLCTKSCSRSNVGVHCLSLYSEKSKPLPASSPQPESDVLKA